MAGALKAGVLTFHKVHQLRLILASTLPGGASDTPPRAFVLPTGDLHVVGARYASLVPGRDLVARSARQAPRRTDAAAGKV